MAYKFNPFTGNFDDFNGPNGEFTSIDVDGDITIGGTGRVSFPLGLAATPSLYPDTDTNTGIYSPGADQLAVATNGTGRLFVDANGNVGLGTSSPANFAGFVTLALADSSGAEVDFIKGSTIQGSLYNANDIFYVESKSTVPTAFVINGSERLRITSAGLVGIGTSSPQSILNLSSTGPVITLTRNNSADTGSGAINFASSDNTVRWQVGTNQAVGAGLEINRGAGTNNAVYIDTSNRVGIGTTAPNRKLEVSDAGADNFIRVNTTGATKSGIEFASSGTAYSQLYFTNVSPYDLSLLQQYTTGSLILGTNSTERARIDSSGRLLVGTSSSFLSYAGLQIKGAIDSGAHIGLANKFSAPTDGSNIGSIRFTNDVGGIGGLIGCEADGAWTAGSNYRSRLLFSTTADGAASPTERLRITSAGVLQIADAGNITVGTTTGTKIGTATTQKLGFYNATPVVQPTAVADATDAATVITQLNDLLAKLRTLGIIAT
jgi:hypothetical protein